MSQLDSIILQLQKVLEEKRGGTASDVSSPTAESAVDTVAAKRALSDFLSRAPESFEGIAANGLSDPAVIESMRKSLIAFIDSPLRNGGTALISGTISPDHVKQEDHGKTEGHGHKPPSDHSTPLNPFTPSPGNEFSWSPPCKACLERKESGETSKPGKESAPATVLQGNSHMSSAPLREGATPAVRSSEYGSVSGAVPRSGYGGAASSTSLASAYGNGESAPVPPRAPLTSSAAPSAADTTPAAAARSPVQALLNVFGARSNKAQKAPEVVAPRRVTPASDPSGGELHNDAMRLPQDVAGSATATMSAPAPETGAVVPAPPKVNNTVLWFKHIQSVEAALRISDVHFATVLVALLFEVATAVEAPPNITARLKTFEARISMEFNRFQEAEDQLLLTIQDLEGTPFESNVSAAWCWHSLAQCYHRQGKHDQSKAAQQKAIAIATAALGAKDPETMLFHEPIA